MSSFPFVFSRPFQQITHKEKKNKNNTDAILKYCMKNIQIFMYIYMNS